jgi:hypothetical protein
MTTDYSDPTTPIPDFPGFPDDDGGLAAEASPHLDSKETSGTADDTHTFRAFAASSCRKDIDFAAKVYEAIDELEFTHKAASFAGCRTSAWFVRHNVTGEIRVASSKCKMRWCPLCIKSRRYVITLAAVNWLADLDRPKFLTLTLKHSNAPLADQIKNLYQLFRDFRRRPWTKKRLKGGIWFFQIKRSKESGQWHPHIHILLDSKFIPKEELSQKWLETTKSSRIIDIRAIHDKRKAAEYVARYAAAPCRLVDYSLDDAVEIVRAMHGLRIVGTFGTAKGCKLTAQKPDDADAWERLDDWKTIELERLRDYRASQIWMAWVKGGKCIIEPDKPKPPPEATAEHFSEPPVSYRQFVFDFNSTM